MMIYELKRRIFAQWECDAAGGAKVDANKGVSFRSLPKLLCFTLMRCDFPTETTDFPTKTTDFPTKMTDFPTKMTDFPIKMTDFSIQTTDFVLASR